MKSLFDGRRRRRLVALSLGLASGFGGVCVHFVHAENAGLGRLFTTPQERQMLEAARHQPRIVEQAPQPTSMPEPTSAPPPLPDVTLNGVVVRSGGRSTVWVNGANSYDGDLATHQVQVQPREVTSSRVPVRLANQRVIVRLKPGQSLAYPGAEGDGGQPAPSLTPR